MAITLLQQANLLANIDFIKIIQQSLATVALEVMTEDPADLDGGPAEYVQRQALARQVLNNAPEVARYKSYILVTQMNSTDPESVTDSNYLTFIRNNWTALAGYNALYVAE